MLIGDIEANGLLDTVDRIWCACFFDLETGKQHIFNPSTVDKIPELLRQYDIICGHNFVGYDIPLLKKILGYEYKGRVFDTLLASRILWPDREGKNPHSVATWAKRFGKEKVEIEDWSYYDEAKLRRCIVDVEIQTEIYNYIQTYLNNITQKDPRFSVEKFNYVMLLEQKIYETIEEQALNGWKLDIKGCYKLVDNLEKEIKTTEIEVLKLLPYRIVSPNDGGLTKAFTKNGEISATAARWFNLEMEGLMGDFCKVQFSEFNLASSTQIKNYLLEKGWKPKEYNLKRGEYGKPVRDENGKYILTSPKLPNNVEDWDEVGRLINNPAIHKLSQYKKMCHRRNQIQGFIENCRGDGRIEARARTIATNTQRMAQSIVVNVPKAKDKIFLGKEMRGLFIAEEGRVLVGCDADALEARCVAHYIHKYDAQLAMMLLSGDIHNINVQKYTEIKGDRDLAKTFIYALIFGCSPNKLADILKISVLKAQALYKNFWNEYHGLLKLRQSLELEYKRFGYLLAIDGRPLTIRYKHALVSSVVQACGAIVMKLALAIYSKKVKTLRLDTKLIGTFHDEFDSECAPDIAEQVGQLKAWAMNEAGKQLKMNVEITGDYKIGNNWAEIH